MKQVIVTIDETGDTKIETSGFHGRECQQATADLERALGIKTADAVTTEMFQAAPAGQVQELQA